MFSERSHPESPDVDNLNTPNTAKLIKLDINGLIIKHIY